MANVIIVSQRLLGHVIPALGIAKELKKNGHNVTVFTHKSLSSLIYRAGLDYEELGWDKYPDIFIEEMINYLFIKLQDKNIDLIINDSSLCAPAYIAEILNIPWVSFQTTVPIRDDQVPGNRVVNKRIRKLLLIELNTIRTKHALPPLTNFKRTRGDYLGLSPHLHLVLVYPELINDFEALPPASKVVGDCSYEEENPTLELLIKKNLSSPTISICTSSVPRFEFQELTQKMLDFSIRAFDKNPYTLFLSLTNDYKLSGDVTENTISIREFPNHNILFKYTNLVITHGGCGTLQKALKYGIPMVVLPLGADHFHLGSIIENLGVGKILDSKNVIKIQEISDSILNNKQINIRSKKLAERINNYNPVVTATYHIKSLLNR
ncbi:glycosyltransferase [Bacillus sp. 166amftsu]|uniref:glycosyltransferase n=1 Tax=Bacillus sp. 166amftsu TaxID=1761753 RepID=UPI0008973078|nr:glycosyltransferase [Bacillus sp. 166amftsu]SDZ40457.1 UDP:flavonoid glycosyltransferase YjiC, YdhE family [Bacillus sp. 166amftsu]